MSARSNMRMRTIIQRDDASIDAYGQKGPPIWLSISTDVPCFAWHDRRRTSIRNEGITVLEGPGMIVPKGTDVTEKDRILSVADREGTALFGIMEIDAVSRRKDHLELRLRDSA